VLARGGVADEVSGRAWLQALLDFEAGLARAQARERVITDEQAEAIVAACAIEHFDVAEIGAGAAEIGNPAGAVVKALKAAVDAPVHHGATSQDAVDTAAMLVTKRALVPLLDDLRGAADAAATLAERHRDTRIIGRTLLQQAKPTTFGLKAAGWMLGLDEAVANLSSLRLSAQLGGPVGTLDTAVLHVLASDLGLEAPLLPQTEVGEVREAAPGGSTSMPHKRNPVAAISALGCAQQAPALVATLLAAMVQEHERAAGAWHSEWRPLNDLLLTTGSAASWLRTSLEGLEIDTDRMRTNLEGEDTGAAGTLVDRALENR
jgi:3-carboxy-cis,cis-muconate cycloisomerase